MRSGEAVLFALQLLNVVQCKLVAIRKRRGLKLDEWKNTASPEPFDL
jgi:hypothetical protein